MSYGLFSRVSATAAVLLALSVPSAFTAEYRDPGGTYALSYDQRRWSVTTDKDGDFAAECRDGACNDAIVGCTAGKQPLESISEAELVAHIDNGGLARAQLAGLVRGKARAEKGLFARIVRFVSTDVAPHLVQPYTERQLAGRSFRQAEFRSSLLTETLRYVSYVTVGADHLITIMCYVSEERADDWRPRFEALVATIHMSAAP